MVWGRRRPNIGRQGTKNSETRRGVKFVRSRAAADGTEPKSEVSSFDLSRCPMNEAQLRFCKHRAEGNETIPAEAGV